MRGKKWRGLRVPPRAAASEADHPLQLPVVEEEVEGPSAAAQEEHRVSAAGGRRREGLLGGLHGSFLQERVAVEVRIVTVDLTLVELHDLGKDGGLTKTATREQTVR